MTVKKQGTSIRLADITKRQITELAQVTNLNQTEVIAMAIDRMHAAECGGKGNTMDTIVLVDAELRGMDVGTVAEDADGRQLGHWPCGLDDAEDKAREEYPEARIVREEAPEQ